MTEISFIPVFYRMRVLLPKISDFVVFYQWLCSFLSLVLSAKTTTFWFEQSIADQSTSRWFLSPSSPSPHCPAQSRLLGCRTAPMRWRVQCVSPRGLVTARRETWTPSQSLAPARLNSYGPQWPRGGTGAGWGLGVCVCMCSCIIIYLAINQSNDYIYQYIFVIYYYEVPMPTTT